MSSWQPSPKQNGGILVKSIHVSPHLTFPFWRHLGRETKRLIGKLCYDPEDASQLSYMVGLVEDESKEVFFVRMRICEKRTSTLKILYQFLISF
ncbi:hypothetical protein Hanom_Chr04g00374331 [Helianthus anomalus]